MLDLVVGIVIHCHIPGPPTFLVNVERLGVAWGRGYPYKQELASGIGTV